MRNVREQSPNSLYTYMQYYGELGKDEDKRLKESVETMLDFIRLEWERRGEDKERWAKGKVFALFTLDSVLVRVHIIQASALFDLLHVTVSHKATE